MRKRQCSFETSGWTEEEEEEEGRKRSRDRRRRGAGLGTCEGSGEEDFLGEESTGIILK